MAIIRALQRLLLNPGLAVVIAQSGQGCGAQLNPGVAVVIAQSGWTGKYVWAKPIILCDRILVCCQMGHYSSVLIEPVVFA